ncbi:hypothetical protein [Burkholderia pseudomallei]|uniref:hypothetical protein n=1 Tax=Burkholderia pseudomallei TaxID=28450 RepID=UPI000F194E51|nr:hypothetical protein [Burkholderia pseudomallei]CAJ3078843.1 Uncharacterised protein [Burkholderia pseudomallei]VCK72349.1 Uncharacterised protein [Burkholderia pseudomallei]VCK79774.1 Uncharacterised protein [Burkholderia pseudomallei]VCK80230.1 Uncharacterised protein [Burkholderia pseudomallei]VCK80603.1 Uncharacterised protein [Burkholderia pseudomallei]
MSALNPALAPSLDPLLDRSDADEGAVAFRVSHGNNADAARQFLREGGLQAPQIVSCRVELVDLDFDELDVDGEQGGAVIVRPIAEAASRASQPTRFFLDIQRQLDPAPRDPRSLIGRTVRVLIDRGARGEARVSHATVDGEGSIGSPDELLLRAKNGDAEAQSALARHRDAIDRFAFSGDSVDGVSGADAGAMREHEGMGEGARRAERREGDAFDAFDARRASRAPRGGLLRELLSGFVHRFIRHE